MDSTYFKFNNNIFKQMYTTDIGSIISAGMVNLIMNFFGNKVLNTSDYNIS